MPGLLSMVAGDFVEVYGKPEQAGTYDCVATCFFIDTAHNILEYLEVIRHVLKVGQLTHSALWLPSGCSICQLRNKTMQILWIQHSVFLLKHASPIRHKHIHLQATAVLACLQPRTLHHTETQGCS